jgi:Na+/H+-dicarboxylate symporter
MLLNLALALGLITLCVSLGLTLYVFMCAFDKEVENLITYLERTAMSIRENFIALLLVLFVCFMAYLMGSAAYQFIQDYNTWVNYITKGALYETPHHCDATSCQLPNNE